VARAIQAGLPADSSRLRDIAQRAAERRGFHLSQQRWLHEGDQRRLTAARAVGARPATAADADAALRQWQRDQTVAAAHRERAALDATQLRTLLAGDTIASLEQRMSTLDERAARLANVADLDEGLEAAGGPAIDGESTVDNVDRLRAAAQAAGRAAHAADVALGQWRRAVAPVGEAEEASERADEQLARLRRLDQTLEITQHFLARAEETAHRTIAPRLVETIRGWLPAITAGRYTDVMVDPERLEVSVRGDGGRWRDAGRLSFGTAEQIYLVLRIALAEHLVRPGVRCPLLLDDVTVHADAHRTAHLLDLLLRASADHQIVLFTQQRQVLDWARVSLAGNDRHAVIELPEVTTV
jgi:uncharacterized protein YhaN